MTIETTGIAQEEPGFFETTDQHETSEKKTLEVREEIRNAIPIDPPDIKVPCCYANDLHINTTIVRIAELTKPSCKLI